MSPAMDLARLCLPLLVASCGAGAEAPLRDLPIEVPETWARRVHPEHGGWTDEETRVLVAALYLLERRLAPDDERRRLMLAAPYASIAFVAPEDAPVPDHSEAFIGRVTGCVYLPRPRVDGVLQLAGIIARELLHAQSGQGQIRDRMQQCDVERRAHERSITAFEALGRLLPGDGPWRSDLELQIADARATHALYDSKLKVFRLLQALQSLDDLCVRPVLWRLHGRCLEEAERDLALPIAAEIELLDEVRRAIVLAGLEESLGPTVDAAREAFPRSRQLQDELERRLSSSRPWGSTAPRDPLRDG